MSEDRGVQSAYYPLIDTLRLYAGWLLTCLSVVYIIGGYGKLRHLPFHWAIFDDWITSPLILDVTFTAFIILLLSGLHRLLGKGVWKGILLTLMGFLLLVVFRANT